MAAGDGSKEPGDRDSSPSYDDPESKPVHDPSDEDEEDDTSDGGSDEEEEEPRLKYANLTRNVSPLYRNGDATSAFVVSGDKMASCYTRIRLSVAGLLANLHNLDCWYSDGKHRK